MKSVYPERKRCARAFAVLCILGLFSLTQVRGQFAPDPALVPRLKSFRTSNRIVISWPVSPYDCAIESASSLTGSWTLVTNIPGAVIVPGATNVPEGDIQLSFARVGKQFFRAHVAWTPYSPIVIKPLTEYFIFSTLDLEIAPDAMTTFNGPVHCSSNIYVTPESALTFTAPVTAVGAIVETNSPLDPTLRSVGTVTFEAGQVSHALPLTIGSDTNHTAESWREMVELPRAGENPASAVGQSRLYNKADLIIELSGTFAAPITMVKSGLYNNFATTVAKVQYVRTGATGWLDYDNTFYNKREGKTVRSIDIDVGTFKQWSRTNAVIRSSLGRDISTIYVIDKRTYGATDQPGVRLVNGAELPLLGLTVATPSPIYVLGHYNIKTIDGFSSGTNTTYTRPAALIGDSITVLSRAWMDVNSTLSLTGRIATNTTVNAALIGGIVQTTSTNFSGGVENFIRHLEDWNEKTLTFNGAIVIGYPSKWASAPWNGYGASTDVYMPPIRAWNYDGNFRSGNSSKWPPAIPVVGILSSDY